jgi:hypothetical protein
MRIPTLLLALSLLAAGTPSLADCVDGQRAATAEEQAFADKLKAALKSALPAAPAPLYLEYEPVAYAGTGLCKGTPIGQVKGMVTASYTASGNYTDRVELKLRTNYAYYGDKDEVIGTLPKNPAAFKVHNLVIKVDGHKPERCRRQAGAGPRAAQGAHRKAPARYPAAGGLDGRQACRAQGAGRG